MISPPSDHTDDMFASACDTTMDGIDDNTAGGTDGIAMDCIDGNSVWQHMLTCFDPGCPDPLCQGGKAVLKHRLSCQVRLPGLPPLAHNKQIIQPNGRLLHCPPLISKHQITMPLSPFAQDPACLLCGLICDHFKMRSNLLPDESNTQGGAVTQGSAVIAAAGAISPDGHVHGLGTGSGRPATDAALSVASSVPPPAPDPSLRNLIRPLSPLGDDEVSGLPPSIGLVQQ